MITLTAFTGEIPRISPRLLPDSAAQIARNCKLLDGNIVPLRYPADLRVMAAGNVSFYKQGDIWFEWNQVVNIVPAPIASNRLYMTGDGVPKIVTDSSVIYPLAVQAPANALTASVTGTPDPTTQETVIYAYTYVTTYDEESEPSPASNEVLRSGGMDVTLSGFEAPPSDRNYNRIRIYRSQTSASGATEFYFIQEIFLPVPTTFLDIVEENPIQEPIPSTYYNPPPDGLSGIIALPNGMMAGFVGNKLYFCEPYIPHAWPEKYVLTTNFDIVGLGAFGRSIAILTTGTPYIATGITPDAMAMEQLEVNNFACINARGIVDLGYSVAYPCPDGLVLISSNGAKLATENLFTKDQWLRLNPQTAIASQYNGRYMMSYSGDTESGAADSGMLMIDLSGEQPFLSRANITTDYMFFEIGAGRLFYRESQNVKLWDAPTQPFMELAWRSKKIVLDGPINFGASQVDAALPVGSGTGTIYAAIEDAVFVPASFQTVLIPGEIFPPSTEGVQFSATVYADGAAVRTFTDRDKPTRLPSGFMARTWEIELHGKSTISAVYLAWSPNELYVGAR